MEFIHDIERHFRSLFFGTAELHRGSSADARKAARDQIRKLQTMASVLTFAGAFYSVARNVFF
jgi:hypothetical protein